MRSLILFALLLLCPFPALGQCAGGSCSRPWRSWRPAPIRPSGIQPGTGYAPVLPQIAYESYYSPAHPVSIFVWTRGRYVLVRIR